MQSQISEPALKPDYLETKDELPHAPQDEPLWSESYLTQAYSPANQVGLFTHINRAAWNPQLWNEVFVVYLPSDQFLLSKSFTIADDRQGPRAAGVAMTFEKPFVEHHVRFVGGARLSTGLRLRAGTIHDGLHVGLEVDLQFLGHGPAIDVGNIDRAPVGHLHYEQHGRVTGTMRYGTADGQWREFEFNGTGLRDHTWGPRDLSKMGRHVWHHGLFADGRWFSVTVVTAKDGTPNLIDTVYVGDQHHARRSRLLSKPALLMSEQDWNEPFGLEVEFDDGPAHIRGIPVQAMPFSWAGTNEMLLGADQTPQASHRYFETQTRWEWGSQVTYGLTERTLLLT